MRGCNPSSSYLFSNFDDVHSFNFNMNTPSVSFASIEDNNIGTGIVGHAISNNKNNFATGASPDASFSVIVLSEPKKSTFKEILNQFKYDFTYSDIRVDYIPCMYETKDTLDRNFQFFRSIPEINHHLSDAVKRGRKYKGTVYITNAPLLDNNKLVFSYISNCAETIEVSGSTNIGGPSYTTFPSPCILVNAPMGGSVFNSSRASFPFLKSICSWTSAYKVYKNNYKTQASTAAGVVALMLESNPELGWRDIQWILMLTATKNDPESYYWKTNAAKFDYHPLLGFGRINAHLACTVAKKWKQLPLLTTVSGSKSGKFNLPSVLEEPLTITIGIEPESDQMVFEYAYLTIKMNYHSFNMFRVFLQSPSGTLFQVISPIISSEEKDPSIRVLIRCFFGEKVKGDWKVIFNDNSYVDSRYITDVKLEIFGIPEMINLPNITKKKAQPIEFNEGMMSLVYISAPDFAECGTKMTMIIKYVGSEKLFSNEVPIILINPETKRGLSIGSCPIDGRPHDIYIPCFSDKRQQKAKIMVDLPEIMQREFRDIVIFNNRGINDNIIPKPYDVFTTDKDIQIPFEVTTHLYKFDAGMPESMFVSLFDADKRKRIDTWRSTNRWEMTANIKNGTSIKNSLLIATPTYLSENIQCNSYIVPIHVTQSSEEIKSFIVSINTSCSLNPNIITEPGDVNEKDSNIRKVLYDVFTVILPELVLVLILTCAFLLVWKLRTGRNPEDLDNVFIPQ